MASQVQNVTTTSDVPQLAFPYVAAPLQTTSSRSKKKLVRRTERDYSQALRRSYQFLFLLMNLWLGGQFYLWVRHLETAGQAPYVSRPAGVEGWLPIAGMMNLKYFLLTGHVPNLHPAAMFLLLTFLTTAFLFRKAFCSWLCPVGTLSEYLWKFGRRVSVRSPWSVVCGPRYTSCSLKPAA